LRIRQGESARQETDRWLGREGLQEELTDVERRLFDALSGSWTKDATADAMWRKESLGALLWALQHVAEMPPYDREFDQTVLDDAITRYGSVSGFRAEGLPARTTISTRGWKRTRGRRDRRSRRRRRHYRVDRRGTVPGSQLARDAGAPQPAMSQMPRARTAIGIR
jgi:hypothetical protein